MVAVQDKEWLTMAEAAEYIGISYIQYTRRSKRGDLPRNKVPGFTDTYRVNRRELDELMHANGKGGVSLNETPLR